MKYHTFNSNIFEDPEFDSFTPEAKFLYLYLFLNPKCPPSGLFKIRLKQIISDTGYSADTIISALVELSKKWIGYDKDKGAVWVRGKMKHHKTSFKGWRYMKNVLNDILEFQDCSFALDIGNTYPETLAFPEGIEILKSEENERKEQKKLLSNT